MNPTLIGNATLYNGDCLDVLKALPANSIEACLTDPPYGLSAHSEADIRKCMAAWLADEPYVHGGKGFMGKSWDSFVPGPEMWRELYRVLKPGAHLLVFAGTRTADLMSLALRLAGFECRDSLQWVFGSGFSKGLDVSKAIDAMKGAEREVIGYERHGNTAFGIINDDAWQAKEFTYCTAPATPEAAQWDGWKSAMKPAYEPILLFRKPLDGTIAGNTLKWGTGGLNIDATRVFGDMGPDRALGKPRRTDNTKYGQANETINPQHPQGRYPANIILDSSEEVEKCFPVSTSRPVKSENIGKSGDGKKRGLFGNGSIVRSGYYDKETSASRFFQHCDYTIEEIAELNGIEPKRIVYSGKASKRDRDEGCESLAAKQYSHDGRETPIENAYQRNQSVAANHHATVKPTSLLRYCLRLICPPGATVIDPFLGSGSTAKAALLEGFNVIGIEREPDYFEICKARVAYVSPETFTVQPTSNAIQRQQSLFTEPEPYHV